MKTIKKELGAPMCVVCELARQIDAADEAREFPQETWLYASLLTALYNADGSAISDEDAAYNVRSSAKQAARVRADLLTRLGLEVDRRRGQSIARLREVAL